MPEFLILKQEGEDPLASKLTALVIADDAAAALKQGFVGEGRYVALEWEERVESDLAPGAVKATGLQDKAKREAAEAP